VIIIDGISYDLHLLSLPRKAEFLDRYANRTEDGKLHRELIGVYFNYELRIARPDTRERMLIYDALWEKLTEPVEFHDVTVPYAQGTFTFRAYFSNISDELLKIKGQENYWKDLTVNFIAQSPART